MNICAGLNFMPIVITIVCCGLLFVYFNSRIAELKFALDKQNKVLTSFITNVQSNIREGGMNMNTSYINQNDNATAQAYAVAREENDKIVVSDDEHDSDSDSDIDSDSDSEDDIESDNEEDDKVNTNVIQVCEVMNGEDSQVQMMSLAFEVLPNSNETRDNSLNTTSTITEITDITEEPLSLDNKEEDINSMKVDDLRKMVIDKQLTSKDEAKKLKKPELLALIKK